MAKYLQDLSLRTILDNLQITESNVLTFEDYISQYLLNHPDIINAYLKERGLYHGHLVSQEGCGRKNYAELLCSFATEDEAIKWSLENGRLHAVDVIEDQFDIPALIVIQYMPQYHIEHIIYDVDQFEETYTTLAFSKKGKQYFLNENTGKCGLTFPYWFSCHYENGTVERGCSKRYLEKSLKRTGDKQYKIDTWREYDEFQKNPEKFIQKKRLSDI
jgi:hypothetical protein